MPKTGIGPKPEWRSRRAKHEVANDTPFLGRGRVWGTRYEEWEHCLPYWGNWRTWEEVGVAK